MSEMTYNVLMGTLNPTHSLTVLAFSFVICDVTNFVALHLQLVTVGAAFIVQILDA